MSSTLKSLRALSDPTRLRIVALLEKRRTFRQRASGSHAARPVAHLDASRPAGGLRAGANRGAMASARFTSSIRRQIPSRANSSSSPSAARRNLPNTQRPDQSQTRPRPPPANRRRFISTRSPVVSTAFTGQAVRGRRSGICCCGSCRRSSWRTWARAKGLLSELLARRCKKVIAVDNSEKIVAFGAAKAKKNGLKNLEFRLGDLQNPPIEAGQR